MKLRKVRVKMPQAQSGLEIKMRAGLGFNANQLSWPVMAGEFSEPDVQERKTLQPVDRDEANLEAEVGETAVTNLNADGIPEQYMIGGKRHYDGGTPLNLPDNSFIFSRDNSMKISDPDILEQFGITSFPKGGVTPADIAKKYNLNKYKKVLLDKNSDDLARSTAEMMIANYTIKLGKLAIIQESMKSFPGGIPLIATPYLESIGLDPDDILPSKEQVEEEVQAQPEEPAADMSYGKYGLVKHQTPQPSGQNLTIIKNQKGEFVYAEVDKGTKTIIKEYPKDYVPAGGKAAAEAVKAPSGGGGSNKGVTVKVKGKAIVPSLSGARTAEYDPRLGKYNGKFNKLTQALNDKDARETFVSQFRARVQTAEKPKNYSDKQWKELKEKWLAMDDNQIVTNFLEKQRVNYAGRVYIDANKNIDGTDNYNIVTDNYDGTWDDGKNTVYRNVSKKLGFTDEELDAIDIGAAQAGFDAIRVTAQMPEFKDGVFKGFVPAALGPQGGNKTGTATGQMINDDKVGGNRTTKFDSIAGDNDYQQYAWFEDEPEPEVVKEEEKEEEELEKIDTQPLKEKKTEDKAPWWLQDIIKTTGAAIDYMGVKKYLPWQATPAVDYLEPTFYSPERELAANAEQLAIGADGAAAFGSPQAYNARFSQMAGKTAENAANILGRYNNLNVGVANEAEKFNVETFNQYADQRAQDATTLYDKVTIANQQFDNSKNQARQNMRQSYIDAITNRAQTQALNTLFTDFYVDPSIGGFVRENIKDRPIKPTKTSDTDSALDNYMKIYERIPGTPAEKNAAANTIYKNMYGTDSPSKKKDGSTDDTYDDDLDRRMKYLEAMTKSRPGFNVYTNTPQ